MKAKELIEALQHYVDKYGEDLPVTIIDYLDDDEDGRGVYPVKHEVTLLHPIEDGIVNEDKEIEVCCLYFENRHLE